MSVKFYIKLAIGFALLFLNQNIRIVDLNAFLVIIFLAILLIFFDEVNIKKIKSDNCPIKFKYDYVNLLL